MKLYFLCFLFVQALLGCNRIINLHVNSPDVYGEYESKYEIAEEKLILKEDSTYIQEVKLNSTSKVDTTNGKWSYDQGTGYITLDKHFIVVLDGFGKLIPNYTQPRTGSVVFPVVSVLGRIRIGSSEGILYKKKPIRPSPELLLK